MDELSDEEMWLKMGCIQCMQEGDIDGLEFWINHVGEDKMHIECWKRDLQNMPDVPHFDHMMDILNNVKTQFNMSKNGDELYNAYLYIQYPPI